MKERIEEILLNYQFSSAQFADTIGVQRSSISHILSGRNKPSFDFIRKILIKYPEINADWLITGRGKLNNDVNQTNMQNTLPKDNNLFNQSTINQLFPQKSKPFLPKSKLMDNKLNSDGNVIANSEVTNVNSIKSIIFLYNDDSFKIINSR